MIDNHGRTVAQTIRVMPTSGKRITVRCTQGAGRDDTPIDPRRGRDGCTESRKEMTRRYRYAGAIG
ncbi:hypothetical protein RSSM_05648 [Rhodopirellula sallentina SM41]|uniref:Uncharacterized protein n=1 Tax=Rhodopirellula sallentina SM41 TaxID=1263870 RepID=M5U4Y7_9BACT|nr:hypothetical protein RSSM_05648 [Rhodopirellula sallentina SM41]